MSGIQCPYCGELHVAGAGFCPNTGHRLAADARAASMPAQPYDAAPPGHGPALQPYAAPQPGYGPAQQPYGAPQPGYGPAQQPYGAPQPGYGPAQQGYVQGAGPVDARSPLASTPIGALLSQALSFYQQNLAPLLLTCAILLVPLSLLKAGATALLLAPTVAGVESVAKNAGELNRKNLDLMQRELAERDPVKRQELLREQQAAAAELSKSVRATGAAALGELAAVVLGFIAAIVGIALLYGFAVPLTTGALTVIVADRLLGGNAGPGDGFRLLLRRLPALLSALIPAFVLVFLGLFFLVLPGLVLGFLFSFVTPVVLLENVGGFSALKRSIELVKFNWLQVAIVAIVFVGLRIVCSFLVALVVPRTAFFLVSFVEDLLLMMVLPIPIIGTVLLYLDIRRQMDGLPDGGARLGLDRLRVS